MASRIAPARPPRPPHHDREDIGVQHSVQGDAVGGGVQPRDAADAVDQRLAMMRPPRASPACHRYRTKPAPGSPRLMVSVALPTQCGAANPGCRRSSAGVRDGRSQLQAALRRQQARFARPTKPGCGADALACDSASTHLFSLFRRRMGEPDICPGASP